MNVYTIDILNMPSGNLKQREIKADNYKIENNRLNFYKKTEPVASYPVLSVNIVNIKPDGKH